MARVTKAEALSGGRELMPAAGADDADPMRLEEGLGFRLSRLQRTLRASWAEELAAVDLTPPLAAILRGVAEHPRCSIRRLARLLGSDAMAVKRGADELERRGLVASGTLDDDRRPRILNLTAGGADAVRQVDARIRRREQVFDLLDPVQRRHLVAAIGVLEQRLGIGPAEHPGGGPAVEPPRPGPGADQQRRERPVNDSTPNGHGQAARHGHDDGAHHGRDHAADAPGATWDERYRASTWSDEPDPTMAALVADLPAGRALDLGGGTGRNAAWLAARGWSVHVVDASQVGLDQAAARAGGFGLTVRCERADLRTWAPSRAPYDLVVLANIHLAPEDRVRLFHVAQQAVGPGGYLYVIGHHADSLGEAGPLDPTRLYTEDLLADLVHQLRIVALRTVEHRADHGHAGRDVALLARREGGADG